MTIKELSQYHNVKIEIQQIKDNIEEKRRSSVFKKFSELKEELK